MTPQPDKLFRDALEEFSKPVPASAWYRVETRLDRRHPMNLWWKVAAGLLLLIAATFIFWPHHAAVPTVALNHKDEHQATANSKLPISSSSEVPLVSAAPTTPVELVPDKKIIPHAVKSTMTDKSEVAEVEDASDEINDEENAVTFATPIENIDEAEPSVEEVASVSTSEDIADETPGHNMKYSAKEVNARFMKKSIIPEATQEKKSTSGVKKVIDVAIGLKNNDSLMGDLRQLKNEYLTINFPEKKRDLTK